MEGLHTPVLLEACLTRLRIKADGIYVDGTLGGGGHAAGICARLGAKGLFIGIDQDEEAVAAAEERLRAYPCDKVLLHRNFMEIKDILSERNVGAIDGGLLDLGVSSFQLDNPRRGFSYSRKAPLDMRMNRSGGFTAYDLVNTYSKDELTRVIQQYGEERWASRISDFIARARTNKPIENTEELAEIIKAAIPASARREGPHPAKRTFQAIRIEVNDEINRLEPSISMFCDALAGGGRLCVISFHSLEDRIAKNVFNQRSNPCACPRGLPVCVCGKKADIVKITRKPVLADARELVDNPRSRSAKLRVVEKRGKTE